MATFEQSDFSGGIYRGRKAPANCVFDCINGLVDDEGDLFRRGGSAYKSGADAGAALEGLVDVYVGGGQRTVFWSETSKRIYTLDTNDSSVVTVASVTTAWRKFSRGVVVNGILWLPGAIDAGGTFLAPIGYAGSRKSSNPGGTAAVTNGSKTVTGTSTSWLTTADAGMIAYNSATDDSGVIRRVVSDTQLELIDAWGGATGAATVHRTVTNKNLLDTASTDLGFVATAGFRLLAGQGSRVYFTAPGEPFSGNSKTDYHQLPDGSTIIGADALRDTAVFFTTAGVWAISNLSLDAVDDAGNIQHQVEQVSRDVILWGDSGVAAWESAFVVPAVDDVYVLSVSGTARPISGNRHRGDGGIRALYRSYVSAGYQPGTATVHRGHYFLPILNGTTWVDTLVCRLDRGFAWTRWAGHAASIAYAQRVGSATRSPKLLAIASQRVLDLTTCLDAVGNASEADGTTHTFTKDSSDVDLGPGIRPDTAEKVRYVYETAGGTPTITVSHAVGAEGASYTAATLKRGGGASDGTDYSAWRVGKKAERIRFRFTTSSAVTSLILRRMEVTIRQAGQT